MKTANLIQALLLITAAITSSVYAHDNKNADCESCKDEQKVASDTTSIKKVENKATTANDEAQLCNSAGNSNSCPLSNGLMLDPLPQLDLDKTPPH